MKYEDIAPMGRNAALSAINSGDALQISKALVSVSLHDPDRVWIEGLLKRFLQDSDPWIRGVAATCVSHVARLHRALDADEILPLLEKLKTNPDTCGKAQDALDDIDIFIKR